MHWTSENWCLSMLRHTLKDTLKSATQMLLWKSYPEWYRGTKIHGWLFELDATIGQKGKGHGSGQKSRKDTDENY